MHNTFKQRVQARTPQFGLFVVSNALQTAEALAGSGYDYLCFDVEHSPSSTPALHAQLAALHGSGTASVVRVAGLDLAAFKHYLDLGVDALMVPNVHTAEMARDAVRYTRYPTAGGVRGLGGTMRATRYGRDKGYYAEAAANTCVLAQIESREGLRNLDAICAVDGVDLLFFGPTDLSADMGHLGQPGHPEVVAAVEAGIRRTHALGKAAGVLAGDPDCQRYLDAGASMVILGSDLGLMVRGADTLAAKYCASR
ncbi:MAG TPA: aldolase/citrate lyase family protein [Pseudorhodoferax sp.]|jgi:2-keto-3-deoxy-L-rhamnonate aldolase RhmA|nr:aldolase/citrate lyase family protein [Pseudorhodoferax sp.]